MEIIINDKVYQVITVKKKIKNIYIKILEDLTIEVSIPRRMLLAKTKDIVNNNLKAIEKMVNKQEIKNKFNEDFYYLGNIYDIVKSNNPKYQIGINKIFINFKLDTDYFYKEEAKIIFLERLIYNYNLFSQKIEFPALKIRSMKTRYGVCNVKTKTITLNLSLIKTDVKYLDYVIIHELAHLVHPNHSKDFWNLVEENCHDYKQIRYEMKNC
ncbi:MAG: YgjP-like metallopeptidase domain-containing protein [Bacilli bacterium]